MSSNILDWRGEGDSYTAIVGNNQMICEAICGAYYDWTWRVCLVAIAQSGMGATKYLLARGEAASLADAQAQAEAYVVNYVAALSPVTNAAIHANIGARGYLKPWTDEQVVAINIGAKLIEELAEACEHLRLPRGLAEAVQDVGELARSYFDERRAWKGAGVTDMEAFLAELADVQVVLAVAVATLQHNAVEGALKKSANDVARGVRGG